MVDGKILEHEAALAARNEIPEVKLFVSAGTEGPVETAIAEETTQLAALIASRGYQGLDLITRSFPGESHITVLPRALTEGLVAVFASANDKIRHSQR